MKTTMDIDDELLIATKQAAARRRTSMKAIVEHALRREIAPDMNPTLEEPSACYKTGKHGLPVLKKSSEGQVRSEDIYLMMEDEGI
jgi:hypothetical protein